jgi:hypothetical protein
MGFGFVSRDAGIRRKALLKPFEAVFVMIALGFVTHEVIGEVNWLDIYFHAVPNWMYQLAPTVSFGWYEAFWFLVLFPSLAWSVILIVGRALGNRACLRTSLLAAATGAAPVVAVAHLAKATAKISSWGGFLPLAINNPDGIGTYRAIAEHSMASPGSLIEFSLVGWVMLGFSVIIAWKAWKWIYHLTDELRPAARAGLAGALVFFSSILMVWVWPGI